MGPKQGRGSTPKPLKSLGPIHPSDAPEATAGSVGLKQRRSVTVKPFKEVGLGRMRHSLDFTIGLGVRKKRNLLEKEKEKKQRTVPLTRWRVRKMTYEDVLKDTIIPRSTVQRYKRGGQRTISGGLTPEGSNA